MPASAASIGGSSVQRWGHHDSILEFDLGIKVASDPSGVRVYPSHKVDKLCLMVPGRIEGRLVIDAANNVKANSGRILKVSLLDLSFYIFQASNYRLRLNHALTPKQQVTVIVGVIWLLDRLTKFFVGRI